MEQDAADEPTARLVEKIEKQKLAETRSQGVSNIPTSNRVDEQDLFAIPNTWKWVPAVFPAVGISDQGKKVKTKDVLPEGQFPVVDQGKVKIRGFCDDPGKVIQVTQPIVIFGDHTRETKFVDFDFVVGADGVKILRPVGIEPRYYHLALSWLPLDSRGYGRHFKLLKSSHVPLPPLAEQHRIVAKVDELPMIDPDEFDEELALAAAVALQDVLERRTHRRKYLGQMYTVPGTLGQALNLPKILSRLNSKVANRRIQGVDEFVELWLTLSEATREKVVEAIEWYDPKDLDWDDKRSNRRPLNAPDKN